MKTEEECKNCIRNTVRLQSKITSLLYEIRGLTAEVEGLNEVIKRMEMETSE